MSTRVKAGLYLALFAVLYFIYVYMTWDARQELAKQWIALGPINWIDFGFGAFFTFMVMMMIFVGISLRESIRFERALEKDGPSGPGGPSSGGAPRRVRLPMSRKVVSIDEFRKIPPANDHLHRGFAESTT